MKNKKQIQKNTNLTTYIRIKGCVSISNSMLVGKEPNQFTIREGNYVQIKSYNIWYNTICIVAKIENNIAYLYPCNNHNMGMYEINRFNSEDIVPYSLNVSKYNIERKI
jgi:hypothetical protein